MIHEYLKTGLPVHYDNVLGDGVFSNSDFLDWTGAPPNDTPDNWTVDDPTTVTQAVGGWLESTAEAEVQQTGLVVGQKYYVYIEVSSLVNGTISFLGLPIPTITANGVYEYFLTATNTALTWNTNDVGGGVSLEVEHIQAYTFNQYIGDQHYQDDCCSRTVPVITDLRHSPPFQFKSTLEDSTPLLKLMNTNGTEVTPQPSVVDYVDIDVYNDGADAWYIHEAQSNLPVNLPVGYYYWQIMLEVGTTREIYYSEVFQVCEFYNDIDESISDDGACETNTSNYILLEWYSECDFDNIVYQYGYKNRLYLDARLDTPRPEISKNTSERDNQVFDDSVTVKNFYQIKTLVPEFMYNALIRLPLYESNMSLGSAVLTLPNGNCATMGEVNITAEWQENSCLCYLTIEFIDEETPLTGGNCCDDLDLSVTV